MDYIRKRLITITVIVLGISFGCLVAYFVAYYSEYPEIQVSQSEINFGEIAAGTKIEKTIDVRNTGRRNLIIHSIKSGCGCVQISLSRNVILPNETAQLHIAMDATEYGQKTSIYIFSNDKYKIMELPVSAESIMQTIVEPSIIDFGQITEGLPAQKEVNILINDTVFSSNERADFVFSTDHAYLKIDSSKQMVGRSKPIVLTLPSDTPLGNIFTELQMQHNSQTVSIRVIGMVRGQFFSLPPMLLFNQVAQEDNVISKTVEIKSRIQDGIEDIPRIDSFELSSSIKSLLTASRSDKNGIILTFSPSNPEIFWSPSTINGTLFMKCSSDHFVPKIVNVPIQITLRVPKIR